MRQDVKRFEAFSDDGQRYIIFKKTAIVAGAPRKRKALLAEKSRYETIDRLLVDYIGPGEYIIVGTKITLRSDSSDAQ